MKASITNKYTFDTIPSASGVEVINDLIFIIGDDSAWLYILNKQAELVDKIPLLQPYYLVEGRIPKKDKPDFECMTSLTIQGKNMLMVAGSGSLSPQRDTAYLITLQPPYSYKAVSLTKLYNQLRNIPEVVGTGKLNIEGIAASHDKIFLLQRGNISGRNIVISYDLTAFYYCILQENSILPAPIIYAYDLPVLDGKSSGFSGITVIPNTNALLITASVEDTTDEIADGAILGSFLGMIDQQTHTLVYVPFTENGKHFIGKVESVAIEHIQGHTIHAIAVTDNDLGSSDILFLEIEI